MHLGCHQLSLQTARGPHLGHGAPDLCALHVGNVPRARQVEPVGLVQLGADQKVEVRDALVLAHQRRRQAQLAVRLHDADDLRAQGVSPIGVLGRRPVLVLHAGAATRPGLMRLAYPSGQWLGVRGV